MRQIAEFVAVLACGLFTGAAIYISLVEHPARMECGVELAAAEFPPELSPSKYHAGDLDGRGSIVFVCSVVRRGNVLVGRCRSPAGFCHPIHAYCDPTDQ